MLSILWNISERSFNVKFLLALLPLRHPHSFITTTLITYANLFNFTNVPCLHMFRISWVVPVLTYPHSSIFSIIPFIYPSNFTYSIITFTHYFSPPSSFFPLLPLSLLTISFGQLSIFCKMAYRFTTKKQEFSILHALLCLCGFVNSCSEFNHQQTLK